MEKEILKKFDKFFVSIGGGTALNTEEEVVAQKKNIKQFISQAIDEVREKILDEISVEQPVAMGVSQWKSHGIKYGYDKDFKIIWPKE